VVIGFCPVINRFRKKGRV